MHSHRTELPSPDDARSGDRPSARFPARQPEDTAVLYYALMDADDRGDAPGLARLAWALFTLAGTAEQVNRDALAVLTELAAAARAAVADGGRPGSLALLRHVLAKRGWLPPHDMTPLQVLAAPAGGSRWRARQLITEGALAINASAVVGVPAVMPD